MAKTILHTQGLSIGYRNKKQMQTIASSIDIDLKEGKLIALIGANGIGKSTLLRTLTGIQKPLSGSIFLQGNALENYSQTVLAQQLSVVLTEKLPPSNLTVFDLVALGRQPYTNWIGTLSPADITKTNEVMALTQIERFASKKHFELSDGQLQKVLIARALAQDTPLIVLDEPTTHLDLLHKVSLFRLLRQLTHETGKCILFSTHDIDLAIELADEMIVMTAQKTFQDEPSALIAQGTFDHLFGDEHVAFDTKKGKFVFKNL